MFLMGFSTMARRAAADLRAGRRARRRRCSSSCGSSRASPWPARSPGASSMILEHAPFGRRGFFASFTLQGVQAGPDPGGGGVPAARPLHARGRVQLLGLAHPVPAQLLRHRRRLHHPPRGRRDPGLRRRGRARRGAARRRSSRRSQNSWPDMLRVVCMALMNVIPVVTTIFGAAYAVQPAYGIGFHKDVYLWIPVLGNIAGGARHPVRRQPVGPDRPPAADHRRRARLGAALVRLSLRHQHPATCRWRSSCRC